MANLVKQAHPEVVLPNKVYRYERESWNDFTLPEFFDANIKRFPIFIGKLREDELKMIKGKYVLKNLGYINAVLPEGMELDFRTYKRWAKSFDDYAPPEKSDIRDRSWEAFVYYNYWDREVRRIDEIFREAAEKDFELERLEYGARRLETVIKKHPEPPSHIYKNLGLAYQFLIPKDPANAQKMLNAWRTYAGFEKSRDDPDLVKIEALLNSQVPRETASEPSR